MTVTTDSPNSEMERTSVFLGMVFICFMMGSVTNFSISSALLPGHWVIIRARVLVTSGNASMGVCFKLMMPTTTRMPVRKSTIMGFLSEAATICWMDFCIFWIN